MKALERFLHILTCSVGGEKALKRIPGYKPLCFIKETLYLYRKGNIYALIDNRIVKIMEIYPTTIKELFRITSRLFRSEPKYAVPVGKSAMIIAGHRKLLLVDVNKKKVIELASSRDGFSDPLNICTGNESWIAIWGDYGSNLFLDEINIYGLNLDSKVEIIYTFKKGQVRHIHNIIKKNDGGFYIFAGDQESGAGIYESDSRFKNVIPLKIGEQKYRAVIGFETVEGLLYATDAVNEKNYIYILRRGREPVKVCELNASCIYGVEFNGNYYFSTTVEPDENNKGIMSWISKKRGQGILSDEVYLVVVNKQMQFKTVMKLKKDVFPMKLFQYGSIQFPKGNLEELWCYPVAVKKSDGVALRLE